MHLSASFTGIRSCALIIWCTGQNDDMLHFSNYMAVLFRISSVINESWGFRVFNFVKRGPLSSHNCSLSSQSKGLDKRANRRRSVASVLCHRSFPRAQNSLLDIRIVLHYGSDLNALIHDLLPTPYCLCRKTEANHIKM